MSEAIFFYVGPARAAGLTLLLSGHYNFYLDILSNKVTVSYTLKETGDFHSLQK